MVISFCRGNFVEDHGILTLDTHVEGLSDTIDLRRNEERQWYQD